MPQGWYPHDDADELFVDNHEIVTAGGDYVTPLSPMGDDHDYQPTNDGSGLQIGNWMLSMIICRNLMTVIKCFKIQWICRIIILQILACLIKDSYFFILWWLFT